jgi:import receptor subunit TOM70
MASSRLPLLAGVAAAGVGVYLLLRWRQRASVADDDIDDDELHSSRDPRDKPSRIGSIIEEDEQAEPAASALLTTAEAWEEATRAKERGNKRFTGRQYDVAVKDYTRAITIAPDPSDERVSVFYCNRAACLSMLDDHDGCVRDCNAALAINPKYVKALNRRGSAFEKAGDADGALLDYTASCLLSCFEQQATIQAADRVLKVIGLRKAEERSASAAPKRLPSPNFIRTFMESFVAHRRILAPVGGQKQTVAQAAARRNACSAEAEPAKHAALLEEEAIALMGESRFDEALAAWEAALAAWAAAASSAKGLPTGKDGRRAHNLVATFYHVRGSLDEALVQYGEALALDPKDANALIKRASLYFEREQMEQCNADFAAAEKASSKAELADVCCHRGQVYMLRGQLDEAVVELKRGLAVDKSIMLTHIQLAMSYFRLNQRDESLKAFEAAERLFPNSAEVFNFHGELLIECGQLVEALAKFDQAIKVGGDRLAAAYVNKANAVAISRGTADAEASAAPAMQHARAPARLRRRCHPPVLAPRLVILALRLLAVPLPCCLACARPSVARLRRVRRL